MLHMIISSWYWQSNSSKPIIWLFLIICCARNGIARQSHSELKITRQGLAKRHSKEKLRKLWKFVQLVYYASSDLYLCAVAQVHLRHCSNRFLSLRDNFCGEMYSSELIRILKTPHNKLEYEEGSCQT